MQETKSKELAEIQAAREAEGGEDMSCISARTRVMRRSLQEFGDRNALLSEEAKEEKDRRARVRETVRVELERHDAEQEELNRKVEASARTILQLQESLAIARKEESSNKA